MRGRWNGLMCLVFLVLLLGCRSPETYLRPPKQPEIYAEVPDDPRYQQPPKFPAEALSKGKDKTKDTDSSGPGSFKGPSKPGGSFSQ